MCLSLPLFLTVMFFMAYIVALNALKTVMIFSLLSSAMLPADDVKFIYFERITDAHFKIAQLVWLQRFF